MHRRTTRKGDIDTDGRTLDIGTRALLYHLLGANNRNGLCTLGIRLGDRAEYLGQPQDGDQPKISDAVPSDFELFVEMIPGGLLRMRGLPAKHGKKAHVLLLNH